MNKLLSMVKNVMFFVPRVGEDGIPGSSAVVVEDTTPEIENVEITDDAPPPPSEDNADIDLSKYLGNKQVNPGQRPLKDFDREGMSQEEIDEFIAEFGDDVFMSDDEIAKLEADKKKNSSDAADAADTSDATDTSDTDGEFDESAFLESTGFTKEEFSSIPEKTQERLVELFQSKGNTDVLKSEQYTSLKERQDKLNSDVAELLKDPVVSARLEELQSGDRFVARELPPVSTDELNKLKSASTVEDFEKLINGMIQSRASAAISRERTIIDRKSYNTQMHIKASGVMAKVAAMDKRLGGKVTVDNWNDINADHAAYSDFQKGEKKIVDFCIKHNLTNVQVANMNPKSLYAAIAAEEGWSEQKERKIAESSVKKFLKSVREKGAHAKSVSEGRRSSSSKPNKKLLADDSFDGMVEKLASGDKEYQRSFRQMLNAADGDPEKLAYFESVQMAASERSFERQNQ